MNLEVLESIALATTLEHSPRIKRLSQGRSGAAVPVCQLQHGKTCLTARDESQGVSKGRFGCGPCSWHQEKVPGI